MKPTSGEPPAVPVSHDAEVGRPRVQEAVGPTRNIAGPAEEPAGGPAQPEIQSAGDLEAAFSEFVASAEAPEAAQPTVEAPATQGPVPEAKSTPIVDGSQEQAVVSQEQADIGSPDELQAALNEFLGSVETQEAGPSGTRAPELPASQLEIEIQPGVPTSGEQPQSSQEDLTTASADDLEGALNQFLGDMEPLEMTPVAEDAVEPPGANDGAGIELDLTGLEEDPSSPESQPAPGLLPTDDLQTALNEFLGSVEKLEADFNKGEPLGPLPQEEKGEAWSESTGTMDQPPVDGQDQPDNGSPDDLQAALAEFLATEGKSGASAGDEQPGPSMSEGAIKPESHASETKEQGSISQDQPEMGFTDDLQAALNEFLGSVEKPEAPSNSNEEAGSAPTSNGGLFLDTLDLSDGEPDAGESQAVPQDKTPNEVAGGTPTAGGSEHAGDDFLAELQQTLASFQSGSALAESPTIEAPVDLTVPPQAGSGYKGQGQATVQPQDPNPVQPVPVAESYSGILYIGFTPSSDATALSHFWDIVDAAAGVGKVIAETPLPDGSGDEFTLDLGEDVLVMEQLVKQIPNADIKALGMDRLRIRLAPIDD